MSNSFGTLFRFTSFGESHGAGIGVVIDGCPAGIAIEESEIETALARRRPGQGPYTSPRKEADKPRILSGTFEGQTTGAPLTLFIENIDADTSKYEAIKDLIRPGHASYTYLAKYGIFDWRGGGRASARETAARCMAGAVAKKILEPMNLSFETTIASIGGEASEESYLRLLQQAIQEGDSLGGEINCSIRPVPAGLGEPIYAKLDALLAFAMLSIPACYSFRMGEDRSRMPGSSANDALGPDGFLSNHSGGTLAGISTGQDLRFSCSFKPTSSIKKTQLTLDHQGRPQTLKLPEGSRHDPCVVFRALPVVEAMAACVLADLSLRAQASQPYSHKAEAAPFLARV